MRPSKIDLKEYQKVQMVAKDTLNSLKDFIFPGVTEEQIASHSDKLLLEAGADTFWYHGIGSLVLVGERTVLSGREYVQSQTRV